MKVQGWMFLLCGVFFAAVDLVYWFWSKDPTGTTALGITVGLAFMIGYYLLYTAARIGPQPEDDKQAEVADGAGEIGFYSPHSWWPLFVGLAAALTFFGFVIGWWLFMIGVALTILATIGWVFQYYRGNFAH
ncbi:cytochrome c oxidase subunit 4 [Rhizohabitans arisaemae]|uniref:cytochrome c oxidase subunit 4 n=1 Tax=Rhizohabitans arisaemae TaxID=2720610 RepID=UPI0024B19B85|nr:cytochrome c oxidase subunit 4 [Rhizohabitans arisaemae]